MCRHRHCQRGARGGRALLPESTPPPLNYVVVTGKLLSDPQPGRGPSGDPVTFLEVEFAVANPEHPRYLWAHATYDVEVPGEVGGRDLERLCEGAPVLVAGQISERLADEDGRSSRHPVILAAQLHGGPDADEPPTPPAGTSFAP